MNYRGTRFCHTAIWLLFGCTICLKRLDSDVKATAKWASESARRKSGECNLRKISGQGMLECPAFHVPLIEAQDSAESSLDQYPCVSFTGLGFSAQRSEGLGLVDSPADLDWNWFASWLDYKQNHSTTKTICSKWLWFTWSLDLYRYALSISIRRILSDIECMLWTFYVVMSILDL